MTDQNPQEGGVRSRCPISGQAVNRLNFGFFGMEALCFDGCPTFNGMSLIPKFRTAVTDHSGGAVAPKGEPHRSNASVIWAGMGASTLIGSLLADKGIVTFRA